MAIKKPLAAFQRTTIIYAAQIENCDITTRKFLYYLF